MLTKNWIKNGGVDMKITVTPPASVGFLSMGRRMSNRTTKKQTHFKTYTKAELEAGVEFELIANRVYELAIATDSQSAQILIEVEFDGEPSTSNGNYSRGTDALLADLLVTTRKAA